ncbi:site-specific integrase [Agrococcus sp. Marseille-Q4369]|uniref:tyrosine-type recombinase/integrase n=1 Tax=Agrococcus sp. Marseille-Q4369 TaxID=2810513 RepID=UPI001B8BC270|nr:site-specific integrase [Agrococcus sp. Marseille-Q4369]QUW18635.1 site-specific integrase [Agrococcus sp. Marseille-Q4369]
MEDGQVKLNGCYRDRDGERRRFQAVGATELTARRELERKADAAVPIKVEAAPDLPNVPSKGSTLRELAEFWVAITGAEGELAPQSIDTYANTVRLIIVPRLGHLILDELTVAAIAIELLNIRKKRSISDAIKTRTTLSLIFQLGLRYQLVTTNFATATKTIKQPARPIVALSDGDPQIFLDSLRAWTYATPAHGPRRSRLLLNVMTVLLGTGMRIGEVLAIRPADIDFAGHRVLIQATVSYAKSTGLRRQEHPKHKRQTRWIPLPEVAEAALLDAINLDLPATTTVFHSRTGGLLWQNNVRRTLRTFIEESQVMALLESVRGEKLTPHTLRKTVGTHVARTMGAEAARDLLGHSFVATTEQYYAKPDPIVDPRVGRVLEVLLLNTRLPSADELWRALGAKTLDLINEHIRVEIPGSSHLRV